MNGLRRILAILNGKVVMFMTRITGSQGTVLPGRLARLIYPAILKDLAENIKEAAIVVTGTNGKTTTANFLAQILSQNNYTVVHNAEGANMVAGITAAFIEKSNWRGSNRFDYAVLETDEANVPLLLKEVPAQYLLVTNFFRDQLDRYGELDSVVSLIKEAVQGRDIQLFLNADDPLSQEFDENPGLVKYYYGFGPTPYDRLESGESREGRYCVRCGFLLTYQCFHYAQLGKYFCPQCGNKNPDCSFIGSGLDLNYTISLSVNGLNIQSHYQGFYNAYNLLAAVSVAQKLGIVGESIAHALRDYYPSAGRMETFDINHTSYVLILVKNPTGFNQSLAVIVNNKQEKSIMAALNDNVADGKDISWIWDVDMESLFQESQNIQGVICSGQRSGEMALRIKYAGWAQDGIQIIDDLADAVAALTETDSPVIYVLCTYTALFKVRKLLLNNTNSQIKPYLKANQPH